MKCSLHKNEFLKNLVKKQKFICDHLHLSGKDSHHTYGDADVLIVETAINLKAVEKSYNFGWR